MESIHNYQRRYERTLERIKESKLPDKNKQTILNFKDYLLSENICKNIWLCDIATGKIKYP